MDILEKSALLEGRDNWWTNPVNSLGLKPITITDGPHGVRLVRKKEKGGFEVGNAFESTCFPTASCIACSFDKELAYLEGKTIAEECLYYGVSVILGPGINLKRNPLCGRNFEYFSEDPVLSSTLAGYYVKGVQENGVSACLKHFICNNTEDLRFVNDSVVDKRALEELYLRNFQLAMDIKKPDTLMTSYNSINGVPACQNTYLLKDVLRNKFNFDGVIMTDWGAMHDRVLSLLATNDLEMPGMVNYNRKQIIENYEKDEEFKKAVDESTNRMLKLVEKGNNFEQLKEVDFNKNAEISYKIAIESCVLLKNKNKILPLEKNTKYLVIGSFFKDMRYQGAGSSLINPARLCSHYDAFKENEVNFVYEQGFDPFNLKNNSKLKKKALKKAVEFDTLILFLGLDEFTEMEGFDRKTNKLPQYQIDLLEALIPLKKRIVIVLSNGSSIEIPFIDSIDGILEMYLAGEMAGKACFNLLFGLANPCGKLAETWPKNIDFVPFIKEYGKEREEYYKESIFIGYRYYLSHPEKILFPFGFGLSYTKFKYSDLNVKVEKDKIKISYKIKNIGTRNGKEISFIFFSKSDSKTFRPVRELKGFDKTEIEVGDTKEIEVEIPISLLEYYEINQQRFILENGRYDIEIGSSSTQIELKTSISLKGEKVLNPLCNEKYKKVDLDNISLGDFNFIYNSEFPTPINLNEHLEEKMIKEFSSHFGKFVRRIANLVGKHRIRKAKFIRDPKKRREEVKNAYFVYKSIDNTPLFLGCNNSNGMLTHTQANGLALMCNGHFFKGLKQVSKKEKKIK